MSLIEIKNIHKSFGSKDVLQGVNLSINEGESLVVIGGSGTGKSVLIKCLLGLIIPDKGDILVDGKSVVNGTTQDTSQIRQMVSMLFQGSALFDSLTIWENVAFYLTHQQKMPRDQAKQMALETLASVGLNDRVADLMPSEISGGMQRRVALARAIIHKPKIILFDEPTTGLDPITSNVINELIKNCVEKVGATAITITHDIASAKYVGSQIAMLYDGKIVWQGAPKDLKDSGDPTVDQFINGRLEGPIKVRV